MPFRESKLTHILKDSIRGQGKLILLAAVSPDEKSFSETLSTLNYGKMAKLIDNTTTISAESEFLEEIAKQSAESIVLESGDKMTFMIPKACGNRTSRGSHMLVDMLEANETNRMVIPVPRVEGKILEVIADYLREQVGSLQQSSEDGIEEWEEEFKTRIEDKILEKGATEATIFLVNAGIPLYTSLSLYLYIPTYLYTSIYLLISIPLYTSLSLYHYIPLYLYTSIYLFISIPLYTSLSLYTHLSFFYSSIQSSPRWTWWYRSFSTYSD